MHGHQRAIQRVRHGLRPRDADQQSSDQTRPRGDGEGVDVAEPAPGPRQRLVDDVVHTLQVRASRKLRDDPAVDLVHVLRVDHVAQDLPRACENGRRSLVTARLETQDERVAHGTERLTVTLSVVTDAETNDGTPSTITGTRRSSSGPRPSRA